MLRLGLCILHKIGRFCCILSDKFPMCCGAGCRGLWGFDHFSYGVTASEVYSDICILEYVCDFAYLQGNVCKYCPFLFLSVCAMVRIVLCFISCRSFCINASGKTLCWDMCRIIVHSLSWCSELSGRLSILSI